MTYHNFGDVSVDHGQLWISDQQNDDYADAVSILSGSDVSLAENQYLVRTGVIYFTPHKWDEVLTLNCYETFGPPEFVEIAVAYEAYHGIECGYHHTFVVVQVGRELDDLTARGTTHESDVVLHGNASIERYLQREYMS